MSDEDRKQHIIAIDSAVSVLENRVAFDGLTEKEKLYAYFMAEAAWEGAKICLLQTSLEAADIFALLMKMFSGQGVDDLKAAALAAEVSSDAFDSLVVYAAAFFSNMGLLS